METRYRSDSMDRALEYLEKLGAGCRRSTPRRRYPPDARARDLTLAVVGASPLIALNRAGRLNLLPVLFDEILVPDRVYVDVVLRGRVGAIAVANAVQGGWLQRTVVQNQGLAPAQLADTGEGEVIALALERNVDIAIFDDEAAHRECDRLDIPWASTETILLHGRLCGRIGKLKPVLDRMQAKGFRVRDYGEILSRAGE